MKKKLAIISYSATTLNTYSEQIKSLFSDKIFVDKHLIYNENLKKGIKADLVLIPSYKVFDIIKPFIKSTTEVIIANRTISKSALEKILNIPDGTKTYLLDENENMSLQMISILYQLGVRHIKITPVCLDNCEELNKKKIIILGTSKYIDESSKNVITLGSSLLDISTIMNIGAKLGLLNILQRQNIKKSYKEIVTTDFGLSNIIGQTNRFESEIDILLQILDDAIIGVNSEGIICTYNESAENIIGYKKQKVIGESALNILSDIPFNYVLKNLKSMKEKLIKINGYDVVVSIHPIIHSNKLYGAVAIIRRFSDIEKKQHKLRAQLIGKGHRAKYTFDNILGESKVITKCKDIAKRMARSDSSVLITGESGTGKELFAQAIHNSSERKNYQFVAVNCGALPESLLESELFGYEEGAFTGARKGGKPGLFELAHNGTLFLDEIGAMPLNLQMRLLRILQEREVMRIGGDRLIKVNIRIVCATNRNLKNMVKKGEFRQDLYYRLNVLPLKIPSLTARSEDILLLVNEIKKELNSEFYLTKEAQEAMLNHNWNGNIRELKNYVEYFTNLCLKTIDVKDLPFDENENLDYDGLNSDEKDLLEKFTQKYEDNIERYIFVLQQLENSYIEKNRIGRRTLYQIALGKGLFLSEQEIRKVLMNLERFLIVKIYIGRSGTVITSFGRKVLKYLKNTY